MRAWVTAFRDRPVSARAAASVAVVLGLVAYAPYLWSGFSADDIIFINILDGAVPYNPWMGLWSVKADAYPGLAQLWWAELSPVTPFLRPLASWIFTLLFWMFGRNALPFHVVLVLLHALAAFTMFIVWRRLSHRDAPAALAAFMFLICEDHSMTVSWINTITDLLCGSLLTLAFLCHLVSRQRGTRGLFALSIALALAAFGSKETAVVYPAMVIAYEFLFADVQDHGQLLGASRIRLFWRHRQAWGIPLVVFLALFAAYRLLVPAWRSLVYWDPFSQPLRFLGALVGNPPVLFVGLATPILPSLAVFIPGAFPFVAALGVMLGALLVKALWPWRSARALWLSMALFVLTALPGSATEPGERLLYVPSLYGFFALAWLVLQLPRLRLHFMPDTIAGESMLARVWGRWLAGAAIVLPVILLFVFPWMWISSMKLPFETVRASLPLIEPQHEHVVYLNTNSSYNTFYLPDIYRYYRGRYVDLRVLSSFNGRMQARQESSRSLLLRTQDVGWLSKMFARLVRVKEELTPGEVRKTPLFTATLVELTPRRLDVREARFDFAIPLDDPSMVLLYFDGRSFRRWTPSAEWSVLNATIDRYSF